MSRSSSPTHPKVRDAESGINVVVEDGWFYHNRAEREWFHVLHEGIGYDVFAYSPAKAQEYFLLWRKAPVEVNWIRRNTALDT